MGNPVVQKVQNYRKTYIVNIVSTVVIKVCIFLSFILFLLFTDMSVVAKVCQLHNYCLVV